MDLTVTVTQNHIDRAIALQRLYQGAHPEPFISIACRCPVALALQDAAPQYGWAVGLPTACAYEDQAAANSDDDQPILFRCRDLGHVALAAIDDFDHADYAAIHPFTFTAVFEEC